MNDDLEIVFKQSAFRHGVTEADIRWAFNTVEFDELINGFENKYRAIRLRRIACSALTPKAI
jgi:hypothetical protein